MSAALGCPAAVAAGLALGEVGLNCASDREVVNAAAKRTASEIWIIFMAPILCRRTRKRQANLTALSRKIACHRLLSEGDQYPIQQTSRNDAQEKDYSREHKDDQTRQEIGRERNGHRVRFINENDLEHNEVVIEGNQTAEQAERDEPEQAVVCRRREGRH